MPVIDWRRELMILRYDRIAMELPPPSDPDPAGAAAVQELMGGRFGEMSTFMNYTVQSFNSTRPAASASGLRTGLRTRGDR
jgi:Mn-containing catalase